jgi:hypothetical protein
MKKKTQKKSAHKKKMAKKQPSSPMMGMPEPEPYSAHFHVTGRSIDDLHDKVTGLLQKHGKKADKGKDRQSKRTTVEDALSS